MWSSRKFSQFLAPSLKLNLKLRNQVAAPSESESATVEGPESPRARAHWQYRPSRMPVPLVTARDPPFKGGRFLPWSRWKVGDEELRALSPRVLWVFGHPDVPPSAFSLYD